MTQKKKGCLKNDLPDEAFVEFECHQISNIVNVFLNPYFNLTETAAIENFGFAIKDNSEGLEFTEQTKTFLAEKYGGPGILTYGSVRCGYAENFQVKGIGSNPSQPSTQHYNKSLAHCRNNQTGLSIR